MGSGKNVVRKRKRRFHGNQYTKNAQNNSFENDAERTSTSSQLETSSVSKVVFPNDSVSGNRILDLEILLNVFAEVSCPECYAYGLVLTEESRYGLCSHFALKCKNCSFLKGFASSKKMNNLPEVNKRLVNGMRQIGKGYSASYKICTAMDLPKLARATYKTHEVRILKDETELAEDSMIKTAGEVVSKTKSHL